MANIVINWTPNTNGNTINQRAYNRQKNIGGAFLTTNFTPTNDLSTVATTSTFTNATVNTVYEFQVANVCTVGGPTFNNNGIREGIVFACVTPTESHTDTTATATVSGLPSDITKVVFNILDNVGTPVGAVQTNTVSGGIATASYSSLTNSTVYIIRIQLIAVVNGVEVTSNLTNCQVGFTTGSPSCAAPIDLEADCVNCYVA